MTETPDQARYLDSCPPHPGSPAGEIPMRRSGRGERERRRGEPALAGLGALVPLAAGYFLSYLFRNANGVVAGDIMRDLGVGADALGLLTSVYFLAFAAAQLPIGMLLDRYGPRRVQGALLLFAAAGAGLCAVRGGFALLLLGRALIGLGTAGSLVAGLKASAAAFPRERLPLVNGAFIMCGGLGALAATWPLELGLRLTDWRGLSAVLAFAAGAVALATLAAAPDARRTAEADTIRLRDVFRDPLFRRFAPLSATCFGTVLAVQGLWAGPWLTDVNGMSRADVANDLAWMAVVLVVAAPCWGVLTRRLRERVPLPRAAACAAVALLAVEALLRAPAGLPGSEGPAARKRTVAACTQCCGSRWALQQTPDPARPSRDEIGQDAGIARSVIPRVRPPFAACNTPAAAAISRPFRFAFHDCTQQNGSPCRHQNRTAAFAAKS